MAGLFPYTIKTDNGSDFGALAAGRADMPQQLVPGTLVCHPDRPEWGVGQVQSVIGNRVTVNFENAGKLLINGDVVILSVLDPRTLA